MWCWTTRPTLKHTSVPEVIYLFYLFNKLTWLSIPFGQKPLPTQWIVFLWVIQSFAHQTLTYLHLRKSSYSGVNNCPMLVFIESKYSCEIKNGSWTKMMTIRRSIEDHSSHLLTFKHQHVTQKDLSVQLVNVQRLTVKLHKRQNLMKGNWKETILFLENVSQLIITYPQHKGDYHTLLGKKRLGIPVGCYLWIMQVGKYLTTVSTLQMPTRPSAVNNDCNWRQSKKE